MMQLTCPCCHAHLPLEAALQDDAGRELIGMMAAMPAELARPLVHYLGYFRPAKQQLGWGRALRMAREVLALEPDQGALAFGLLEAARGLDEKRALSGWKPLGNHNYLRRVLESTAGRFEALPVLHQAKVSKVPQSKTGSALVALESLRK